MKTGLPWRYLPNDFPPWEAVYQQTRRWIEASVFEAIAHDLRALLVRLVEGKGLEPSATILDQHLIVDNDATHKHPKVRNWLKRHKRFHIPFIPTSSSWRNVIEGWFRDITHKRIRHGVFKSVEQLQTAIKQYTAPRASAY